MDIVASGTEAWLAYRQLGEEYPDLVEWKVNYRGDYVFNMDTPPQDDTRGTIYYSSLTMHTGVPQQTSDKVQEFLETLPMHHKELAYCLFYDNTTKTEAARRLNVSRRSVYNYILAISGAAVTFFSSN